MAGVGGGGGSSNSLINLSAVQLEAGSSSSGYARLGGNYQGELATSGNVQQSPNFITNGAFEIWQRGTSIVTNSGRPYAADRWECYRSGWAAGMTISQQPSGTYFFTSAMRVQRNSGDTSTAGLYVNQALETVDSLPLLGQTVTLSFYLYGGADLVANNGVVTAKIYTGTGTDNNFRSGFTGGVIIGSTSITVDQKTRRYSVTAYVPNAITQVGIQFEYLPTGTAGANDWFHLLGVQLEIGDGVTFFRRQSPSYGLELQKCQRYYWRVYSGDRIYLGPGQGITGNTAWMPVFHPVQMRTNPWAMDATTIGFVNSSGGNAGNVVPGYGYSNVKSMFVTGNGLTGVGAAILGIIGAGAYLGFEAEL